MHIEHCSAPVAVRFRPWMVGLPGGCMRCTSTCRKGGDGPGTLKLEDKHLKLEYNMINMIPLKTWRPNFSRFYDMTEVMYFQTAGYTGFDEQPTDLVPNGMVFIASGKTLQLTTHFFGRIARSDRCRELGKLGKMT